MLQAMDNSHVALVSVKFQAPAFKRYRCDRPIPLGVNLTSLTKVLRCAKDDDICTLKAADEGDVLNLVYEAKSEWSVLSFFFLFFFGTEVFEIGSDRIAEYDMKLMDIDADTLNIPETEYDARVTMQSSEFSRIVKDLSQLGEAVRIEVSKEGVRFASDGEAANGSVLLRQTDGSHIAGGTIKPEEAEGTQKEGGGEDGEEEEEAEGSGGKKSKKTKVKKEKGDNDDDVEMDGEKGDDDEGEFKPAEEDEGEGEDEQDKEDEEEEEESGSKKRKQKVCEILIDNSKLTNGFDSRRKARNRIRKQRLGNRNRNLETK